MWTNSQDSSKGSVNTTTRVKYAIYHTVTNYNYVLMYHIRTRWGFLFRTKTPGLERGNWMYCHVPYNEKVCVKVKTSRKIHLAAFFV